MNITAFNNYMKDNSAFTANASESTRNSKSKRNNDNKIIRMEGMRKGKNIQIANNIITNQKKITNASNIDCNLQISSMVSTANNNTVNNNNRDNMIISNIQNNENYNFLNQKGLENKKNSLNHMSNVNNRNTIDSKAIQSKIEATTHINPLKGSFNLVANMSYVTSNHIDTKNNLENSVFLESQNANLNDNMINLEAESEEESETKEDGYILELIYSRRFSELSDKDLLSNLLFIAKEQAGCRFLQQKIDDNPNFTNYELYSEINEYIGEFICDPFGNYLIQKMLENLATDKIDHMMKNVI
jgi:hypothetical protein